MKTKSKRSRPGLFLLICTLCFISSVSFGIDTLTINRVNFDASTGTITRKFNSIPMRFVIPETFKVNGADVAIVAIGSGAFHDDAGSLAAQVVFSEGLVTIGNNAFEGNDLEDISIPNSVTHIGERAFYNNDISSLTLSENLGKVEDYAFANNEIEDISIPTSVTEIGICAFASNALTYLYIPATVQTIEELAFVHNSISALDIEDFTIIGPGAFNNNLITEVNYLSSDGYFYFRTGDGTEDATTIVSYGGPERDFDQFPDNVSIIGDKAFNMIPIESLSIPAGIESIRESSFDHCSLTDIYFEEGIDSIGKEAFANNFLKEIILPNSLK